MRGFTERSALALAASGLAGILISVSSTSALADSAIYALHRAQEPCYDPSSAAACRAAKYNGRLAGSPNVTRRKRQKVRTNVVQ